MKSALFKEIKGASVQNYFTICSFLFSLLLLFCRIHLNLRISGTRSFFPLSSSLSPSSAKQSTFGTAGKRKERESTLWEEKASIDPHTAFSQNNLKEDVILYLHCYIRNDVSSLPLPFHREHRGLEVEKLLLLLFFFFFLL